MVIRPAAIALPLRIHAGVRDSLPPAARSPFPKDQLQMPKIELRNLRGPARKPAAIANKKPAVSKSAASPKPARQTSERATARGRFDHLAGAGFGLAAGAGNPQAAEAAKLEQARRQAALILAIARANGLKA